MRRALRRVYIAGGLFFLAALCTALLGAQYLRVHGATIIVTNTNDNGPGTLRQAIADAQNGDTIQFDPALIGQTILLTTGELLINKNITISGPSPVLLTVSAIFIPKFLFRDFHISPGQIVTISGLTIRDGYGNGTGGGGILNDHANLTITNCWITNNHTDTQGAGIYNDGTGGSASLTIDNSMINNNTAFSSQAIVAGGGIANDASNGGSANLTTNATHVDGNIAEFSPQGQGNGGGIYNTGTNATVMMINSNVNNNRAGGDQASTVAVGQGGGIWNSGSATITNISVNNNYAGQFGGGISNSGTLSLTACGVNNNGTGDNIGSTQWGNGGGIYNSGMLTITSTTLNGNLAVFFGGGLYGNAVFTNSRISDNISGSGGGGISGDANLTNCTISGNRSIAGNGGGIGGGAIITNCTISGNNAVVGSGISGGFTITNSTISGNSASSRGALWGVGNIFHSTFADNAGGAIVAAGTVDIGGTILKTGSSGANLSIDGGTIQSQGYNISNDDGGGFLTSPGDQINTDPLLGPLQNNGGSTFTHSLLPNSPAFNTGDPSFTPPPDFDQRGPGYPRVALGQIDIGSFEVQSVGPTPTATPTATSTAAVTPTPSPSPSASASATATATASPTPPPTPTVSPSPAQALNLSTRMLVQAGDNVGIGGFIVTGSATKRVIVRAIGPSLAQFGVPDAMADPTLELHGPGGFVTITNNNWRDNQEAEIIATGLAPTDNLESAIVANLVPGNYTAIVAGNNNTTGVALVEVYDLQAGNGSKLGNISTRAFVSTGGNVVIAGFILGNSTLDDQVIIRGIGPSLGAVGVSDPLGDPTLELYNSSGTLLVSNNNWQENAAQAATISVAGLAPNDPLEAAIARTLSPGQYTALLAGFNNGTGVGLVEVYDKGAPLIVTTTADSGPGSLRDANAVANDGDMIQFDSSLNGQTILLTSGEILIDKNVTIKGPGPDELAVSRDSNAADFRILHVTPNHTVLIEGLKISGGRQSGSGTVGGGIYNEQATLTISNCNVSGNSIGGGFGGGIYSNGILAIADSTVGPNSAGFQAPFQSGNGSGISSVGPILTIIRSTIANNSAYSIGGGIYCNGAIAIINDSTISGNFAAQGGGISVWGAPIIPAVTVAHCTISGNHSGNNVGDGIFITTGTSMEIGNTILDSGSGRNIFADGDTVTSNGYNLSTDDAGGFLTAPGDQVNTDPILGPLQNNGGATFTHALIKGSPAINAGDPNFTPPPFTDQRSYLRVYDGLIDIGSFEVQPVSTPSPSPASR